MIGWRCRVRASSSMQQSCSCSKLLSLQGEFDRPSLRDEKNTSSFLNPHTLPTEARNGVPDRQSCVRGENRLFFPAGQIILST